MKNFLALCTLLVFTSLSNTVFAETSTILFVPKDSLPFWDFVQEGAEQAASDRGVKLIFRGPTMVTDTDAQMDIIQNTIDTGVDAIVLAPAHTTRTIPVLRQAREKGIKIVVVDSDMDFKDRVSYVATDNYDAGKKAANYLKSLLKDDSTVLILRRQETNNSTAEREQGVKAVLNKNETGQINIRSVLVAGSAGDAYHKVWDILLSMPKINAVISLDEATSVGALHALEEAGYAGKTKFVCIDFPREFEEALKTKKVNGMVLQDPYSMGYKSVIAACDALEGQNVPERIVTSSFLITTVDELDALREKGRGAYD